MTKKTDSPVGTKWVVWTVWGALTVTAAGYVIHFGSNVPYWDEWSIVDVVSGAQPLTFEWLWSPHNGHRVLLPRLVLLGLYKASGVDFRVGMYFNVAVLAAASAALVWASSRIRGGQISVADTFFPLLLLHWGHYENLLWSWQTTFVLPIAVICGVLAIAVVYGLEPPLWLAVLAVVGVLGLTLSDVPGLAYGLALAVWVAAMGVVASRDDRPRRAIALWLAAGLTIALVALYFYKYTNNSGPVSLSQPVRVLQTAVRFAAGGLGPGVQTFGPVVGTSTVVVLLATAVTLALAIIRHDPPPCRAFVLMLFLAGAACLIIAFATARTASTLVSRYFLLATPLWCSAFLAWPLCVRPTVARRAQAVLLTAAALLMPLNVSAGLRYARDYHCRMESFRTDLRAGQSPEELVAHHIATLCPCLWLGLPKTCIEEAWGNLSQNTRFPVAKVVSFHDSTTNSLRNLHQGHVGDFAHMRIDEPLVREIVPSFVTGFTITRASAPEGTALADRAVLLTPALPLYVIGARLRRPSDAPYDAPSSPYRNCVQVFWRSPGEVAYMAPNHYVFFWEPAKDEQIVWIFQPVNQIALHVGDPDLQRRLGPDELPIKLLLPIESSRFPHNLSQ